MKQTTTANPTHFCCQNERERKMVDDLITIYAVISLCDVHPNP